MIVSFAALLFFMTFDITNGNVKNDQSKRK